MRENRIITTLGIFTILFVLFSVIAGLVLISRVNAGEDRKIRICHWTEAGKWNSIKVSKRGLNGHGDHNNDIIPSFGDYQGLNWPRGEQVWENDCVKPELSPTPTVTPSPSPSPSPEPTESPEPSPSPEPSESPSPTPVVTVVSRGTSPAGVPPLPVCESPIYAPTITYLGQTGDTFSYRWTTVRDDVHSYWINYGSSPEDLPYSLVVEGESVDITMYGQSSNWIQVAGYDNGCIGVYSEVTN